MKKSLFLVVLILNELNYPNLEFMGTLDEIMSIRVLSISTPVFCVPVNSMPADNR